MNCYVADCKHYGVRDNCLSMFRPPTKEPARTDWLQAIRRTDFTPNSRICSCHFKDNVKAYGPTLFNYNNFGNLEMASPSWPSELLEQLRIMRSSGFLCDVKIVTSDNVTLKFHSVVLAAVSPAIEEVLKEWRVDEVESITIESGFDATVWQPLIDYMYKGQYYLTTEIYTEFLELLEQLKIDRIKSSLYTKRNKVVPRPPCSRRGTHGVQSEINNLLNDGSDYQSESRSLKSKPVKKRKKRFWKTRRKRSFSPLPGNSSTKNHRPGCFCCDAPIRKKRRFLEKTEDPKENNSIDAKLSSEVNSRIYLEKTVENINVVEAEYITDASDCKNHNFEIKQVRLPFPEGNIEGSDFELCQNRENNEEGRSNFDRKKETSRCQDKSTLNENEFIGTISDRMKPDNATILSMCSEQSDTPVLHVQIIKSNGDVSDQNTLFIEPTFNAFNKGKDMIENNSLDKGNEDLGGQQRYEIESENVTSHIKVKDCETQLDSDGTILSRISGNSNESKTKIQNTNQNVSKRLAENMKRGEKQPQHTDCHISEKLLVHETQSEESIPNLRDEDIPTQKASSRVDDHCYANPSIAKDDRHESSHRNEEEVVCGNQSDCSSETQGTKCSRNEGLQKVNVNIKDRGGNVNDQDNKAIENFEIHSMDGNEKTDNCDEMKRVGKSQNHKKTTNERTHVDFEHVFDNSLVSETGIKAADLMCPETLDNSDTDSVQSASEDEVKGLDTSKHCRERDAKLDEAVGEYATLDQEDNSIVTAKKVFLKVTKSQGKTNSELERMLPALYNLNTDMQKGGGRKGLLMKERKPSLPKKAYTALMNIRKDRTETQRTSGSIEVEETKVSNMKQSGKPRNTRNASYDAFNKRTTLKIPAAAASSNVTAIGNSIDKILTVPTDAATLILNTDMKPNTDNNSLPILPKLNTISIGNLLESSSSAQSDGTFIISEDGKISYVKQPPMTLGVSTDIKEKESTILQRLPEDVENAKKWSSLEIPPPLQETTNRKWGGKKSGKGVSYEARLHEMQRGMLQDLQEFNQVVSKPITFDDSWTSSTLRNIAENEAKVKVGNLKGIGDESTLCDECGASFKSTHSMHRHLAEVHLLDAYQPLPTFLCTVCGLEYKRKSALQKHLQKKHGSSIDSSSKEIKNHDACINIVPVSTAVMKPNDSIYKVEPIGKKRKSVTWEDGRLEDVEIKLDGHIQKCNPDSVVVESNAPMPEFVSDENTEEVEVSTEHPSDEHAARTLVRLHGRSIQNRFAEKSEPLLEYSIQNSEIVTSAHNSNHVVTENNAIVYDQAQLTQSRKLIKLADMEQGGYTYVQAEHIFSSDELVEYYIE